MNPDLNMIQPGSEVLMHFTIRLEDGTVAESSVGEEPLRFKMGDGTLVEGLELALLGLKPGDKQKLQIPPENAYGYAVPSNVQPLARDEFPEDMELKRGVIIGFTTPDGEEVPGMILEVGDEQVTVDFNHPLASHEITFEVEILEVHGNEAPPTLQ